MYSKKVLQYFLHPRNLGKIKNPDGVGKAGNPNCGDVMTLYIKVGQKNKKEFIKDIKFETIGCAAAISSSSILTEMVKGKEIDKALKFTKEDVAKKLGGLPPIKMHCSNMAVESLKKAVENYHKK